ncbi:MAG: alpha/beta hydrolase-fold protein [candidate division KSB1 bacterium]|nr:alpha/beta hydrolase-fold protein [candidate division KSB1 bacterium]
MRRGLVFLLFVWLCPGAWAQSGPELLARIFYAPETERQALVDSLDRVCAQFPLLEQDSVVHFVYRGQAKSVALAGDATAWQPRIVLKKIAGTDLWHARQVYEPDARLDYKLVLDDTLWVLDPRNPHTVLGGFGANSELRMPQYVPPEELLALPDGPRGTVRDTSFTSSFLSGQRTVWVYLPPGYPARGKRYPLALFHDGSDYLRLGNALEVLDRLIEARRIQPVVAVFVPPGERQREYAGDRKEALAGFICAELLPWVERRYHVSRDARLRASIGASNGGNISLWLGLHYPEQFGTIAAQSSYVEAEVATRFREGKKLPLRIYLDVGTYDIPLLIPMVRTLRQILVARGYEVLYQEFHEGHSWGNWRAHLDDILEWSFPGETALRGGEKPCSPPPWR